MFGLSHQRTISAEYVTQTITKCTIIMAELNQKTNKTAAPFIKHISADELYLVSDRK